MTEQEKINGWTFEETVKTAENLMENEQNMFKWDVLRHLRDFAETFKEELEQYRALGTVEEILKVLDNHKKVVAMQHETLKEYRNLGTVEKLRVAKELYDSINKIEDDICRLGMGCDDLREHIKQIYKQFRGKV